MFDVMMSATSLFSGLFWPILACCSRGSLITGSKFVPTGRISYGSDSGS